jgi:hypothetical protein
MKTDSCVLLMKEQAIYSCSARARIVIMPKCSSVLDTVGKNHMAVGRSGSDSDEH